MMSNLLDRCFRLMAVAGRLIVALAIVPVLVFSDIRAEENRHHEAHEHGVATLNVAVDGNSLHIEFSSPAANIVGFEHPPRTQEQKAAIKKALKRLEDGDVLFVLSKKSDGRLVTTDVRTDIDNHISHHQDSEHSDEEKRHDDHAVNHGKAHPEVNEHQRHSEFTAKYHFIYSNPNRLTQIDVKLFEFFPGIEHIEVQLLTATKQTAMELTANKNRILF